MIAAVAACKMAVVACRILGKGGTDKPGRLALKLCPKVLTHLSKKVNTVIITGTNGKTTTSRIVEKGLKDAGYDCFANRSGANLLSGIVTCFAQNANIFGSPKHGWAVIECDEAALKQVSRHIKPVSLTVTNIFRDQLDRFGEVSHTIASIKEGISNIPQSTLCLNADCSMTWSLATDKNPVVSFGVDVPTYESGVTDLSDAPYCIHCKTKYEYSHRTFAHLGSWSCPGCGYKRPEVNVAATAVHSSTDEGSLITLKIGEKEDKTFVNLAGGYNIYNACAAAATLKNAGVDDATVRGALSAFEGGFGRMESMDINGLKVRMVLVKNPTGCNQTLNYLTNLKEKALFIICLNDHAGDGTDVSWIWDTEFENLAKHKDMLSGLWVSGIRADEMAMRLKYAGFDESEVRVIHDYDTLLGEMTAQSAPVYIMPTYTAMMDLRGVMQKRFNLKEFWK